MRHPFHNGRTLSLFDSHAPREKGSREWGSFNAVKEDRVGGYRVALPKKPMVVKGPRHILRIITPRAPRTLRSAH